MTRMIVFLFLIMGVAVAQVSDTAVTPFPPPPVFLNIVLPESDTVWNSPFRYRLAASTNTTSRAFINGEETKVYGSGAFVGLFRPPADTSHLTIMVIGSAGDSLSRSFVFIKPASVMTSPRDTLVIERESIQPSQEMWLAAGDVLDVRFKGSPGWEATFSIPGVVDDAPMRELDPKEARGLGGVYVGRYIVQPGAVANSVPVEFRLRKSFWSSERAESEARVSMMPDSLPRTAEIIGRRPFINVGLGTDRLGGAKLGYIEPGGKVNVTGKVGRQYRVRLSEQLVAWIPAEYIRLLSVETSPPASLTGSISVTGTDSEDVVFIGLSERLPYRIDHLFSPTVVLLDVYGATSNTNWITHNMSAKGVKSVSWEQVASDQYRLRVELNHDQHWGSAVSYSGTGIRIVIRRPPAIQNIERPFEEMTIALDAGHGGSARGALGATGAEEQALTLAIVQQLDSVIQARGGRTVLTRTGDEGPGMTERAEIAIRSGARILVSVHCNSTGLSSDPLGVSGTAMFYRYLGFKPLADMVFAEMIKTGLKEFGVVGSFNFSLNGPTELPNVLVETAFMSHPEDEMFLLDPVKRTEVAVRVADGLEKFFLRFGRSREE